MRKRYVSGTRGASGYQSYLCIRWNIGCIELIDNEQLTHSPRVNLIQIIKLGPIRIPELVKLPTTLQFISSATIDVGFGTNHTDFH